MFPANFQARSVPTRSQFFAAVCSDAGKYTFANSSAAAVPKTPDLLNLSNPASVRVINTRCAEYFTLPHKLGRYWGKKRGSSCRTVARTKLLKKLFEAHGATPLRI